MTDEALSGPTFLLIGAARSATTYLAHQLDRHPDIEISDPKEPHFLALGGAPVAFTGPGDDETINRVAITDVARWRGLFSDAPHRGEGSVSTLYYPTAAIAAIERHAPDVRLVAVLREPIARAHSAWQYQVSRGFETEDLITALRDEPRRIAAGWHHIWHYVAMGRYAEQLAPFIEALGRERLLVVGHDELEADPQATIDRVAAHIGAAPLALDGLDAEINRGGAPRSRAVARAMSAARAVEPLRRTIRRAVPLGLRERLRTANLEQTAIDPAAQELLDAALGDEAAALRALLGTDAPPWAGAP